MTDTADTVLYVAPPTVRVGAVVFELVCIDDLDAWGRATARQTPVYRALVRAGSPYVAGVYDSDARVRLHTGRMREHAVRGLRAHHPDAVVIEWEVI